MTLKTTEQVLTKAFEEITDAPDRTLAIVASCLLETILEDAIVTRLRPMSNTHRDDLFKGEAGFAGFAAKINLGFSLGLYGPKTKNDLDYVRKNRNQFAHHVDRDFGHPEITKHCALITDYSKAPDPAWSPVMRALLQKSEGRWRYLTSIMHFLNGLLSEMHHVQYARDPTALP